MFQRAINHIKYKNKPINKEFDLIYSLNISWLFHKNKKFKPKSKKKYCKWKYTRIRKWKKNRIKIA